jgi:hypothetical protein
MANYCINCLSFLYFICGLTLKENFVMSSANTFNSQEDVEIDVATRNIMPPTFQT